MTNEMATDHLRLYRSATTPVGISKMRIETSITVPSNTSWNGSSSTSVTSRRKKRLQKPRVQARLKMPDARKMRVGDKAASLSEVQ